MNFVVEKFTCAYAMLHMLTVILVVGVSRPLPLPIGSFNRVHAVVEFFAVSMVV
jgi:hypothetical protein